MCENAIREDLNYASLVKNRRKIRKHSRYLSLNYYFIKTNNRFRRFFDNGNQTARRADFRRRNRRRRRDGFSHVEHSAQRAELKNSNDAPRHLAERGKDSQARLPFAAGCDTFSFSVTK